MRTKHTTRTVVAASAALALGLGLAACSEDTDAATTNTAEPAATSQPNDGGESEAAVVVFQNGWAKATDTDMSGAFGTLRNTGDVDVRITGVTSPVSEVVEMHEMVPAARHADAGEGGGFVISPEANCSSSPAKSTSCSWITEPITTGQVIPLVLNPTTAPTRRHRHRPRLQGRRGGVRRRRQLTR